jgi:tRNA G18 (ribose-2'-O)-methylase SpoU
MRKLTHEEISANRIPRELIHEATRLPIYGLLDNIRSLYNVGSMFRTSDGGLVGKLYLCGYTPTPPRKEIEKTSLGASSTGPWEYYHDPLDAINHVRAIGGKICVLEQTTPAIPYYAVRRDDFPLCLVVGNELTGVSPRILNAADMGIEIPMFGTKQSLNAAVAYGIALFELVKIWKGA